METQARLTAIGNITEGTNKQGNPYRFATAVFETLDEKYPKKMAMKVFNAQLENICRLPLGTVCNVKLDASSREFNGKWYTDITAYDIQAQQAPQEQTYDQPIPSIEQPRQGTMDFTQQQNDDLPF